jgi:hypothetical protein
MKLKLPKTIYKFLKLILITLFSATIVFYLLCYISERLNPPSGNIKYGVTFSPLASKALRQNWQDVYTQILDDLNVKILRIPSYWTDVEPESGKYDFSEVDFMVGEAGKRGAKVVLSVGMRQPRWPECHIPDWAKKLTKDKFQDKTKQLIEKTINRYKDNPAVESFQVENEPLFPIWAVYCNNPDPAFFKSEAVLARSLTDKKIMTSASGEWDVWIPQMQVTDVLGISLYRRVHNKYTGYFYYPLIPGFYSLKSNFSRWFAPGNQKTIITELQAEPWFGDYNPLEMTTKEQRELFTMQMFKDNVGFAERTSFDEIYLWGVEWWYLMKQKGDSEYWEYAKQLIAN